VQVLSLNHRDIPVILKEKHRKPLSPLMSARTCWKSINRVTEPHKTVLVELSLWFQKCSFWTRINRLCFFSRLNLRPLIFLPRDAMLARYMLSCVRLSVRLSVISRCSIKTAKHSITQTTPYNSQRFQFFDAKECSFLLLFIAPRHVYKRDRATRYVSWNLVNCCTAVRIITFEDLQ